jgi:ADP-ribose pyrophosphatase
MYTDHKVDIGTTLNKRLSEEKIGSKKLFQGEILGLYLDRVRLPNGKTAAREMVSHPGAVGIIPVTGDNNILMVRQYRYPVGEITIEIPAGKLDKNESPEKCARREMAEEVGASGGSLKLLSSFYTTPGFSDEVLHLYLATGFSISANNLDQDEFLDIISMGLDEACDCIKEGRIKDSKTIIAILMAKDLFDDGN